MNRKEVLNDIKETLGIVPGFLESLPDEVIDEEWRLFKKEMTSETVPAKYQHLIGLGVASAIRCQYCVLFHTSMARALGATDAELNFAVREAKQVNGWSTYVHGIRYDINKFQREVDEVVKIMRDRSKVPVSAWK